MIDVFYKEQLIKKYKEYLAGLVLERSFVPVVLRGGKNKPASTVELHKAIGVFQEYEKTETKKGWKIEWEEWSSKKLGKQRWPLSVTVDAEQDFLFLTGKENETRQFKETLQTLLAWQPALRNCLCEKVHVVLDYRQQWKDICKVVDYLLQNDVSNYYLRSLPVPVHTKFIEQHKPVIYWLLRNLAPGRFKDDAGNLEAAVGVKAKPYLFPMRWLDADLAAAYTQGMEVMGITAENLRKVTWVVKTIFLVENETSLYMLPSVKGCLAICSKGFSVELLAGIPLLSGTSLVYWGDMDEEGYAILQLCRGSYHHATSMLMNNETLQAHLHEVDKQPAPYKKRNPALLSFDERQAFEFLRGCNGRLEQEKLQHTHIYHACVEVCL